MRKSRLRECGYISLSVTRTPERPRNALRSSVSRCAPHCGLILQPQFVQESEKARDTGSPSVDIRAFVLSKPHLRRELVKLAEELVLTCSKSAGTNIPRPAHSDRSHATRSGLWGTRPARPKSPMRTTLTSRHADRYGACS